MNWKSGLDTNMYSTEKAMNKRSSNITMNKNVIPPSTNKGNKYVICKYVIHHP